MSWDLSSEEVIVDKLENQQRTIFAFSSKIKELEQKLAIAELKNEIMSKQVLDFKKEYGKKFAIAKEALESVARYNGDSQSIALCIDVLKQIKEQ